MNENIGYLPMPEDFAYREIYQIGKSTHVGDYFSLRHPHMPSYKRAKLFAPFAALRGFDKEISAKEIHYTVKKVKDEESLRQMNEQLNELKEKTDTRKKAYHNHVTASVSFFVLCDDPHNDSYRKEGTYQTVTGMVLLVDAHEQFLQIDDQRIPFADIDTIHIIKKDTESSVSFHNPLSFKDGSVSKSYGVA